MRQTGDSAIGARAGISPRDPCD